MKWLRMILEATACAVDLWVGLAVGYVLLENFHNWDWGTIAFGVIVASGLIELAIRRFKEL